MIGRKVGGRKWGGKGDEGGVKDMRGLKTDFDFIFVGIEAPEPQCVLRMTDQCAVVGPGDRLWFKLLRASAHLHVHSVALLPCARGDTGLALWSAH